MKTADVCRKRGISEATVYKDKARFGGMDTSLSGLRATRELDALIRLRGKPVTVVSDSGAELTSTAVLKWCGQTGIDWHCIQPGKPMQAGFVESFHGSFRASVSTKRCSCRSPEARSQITAWKEDYDRNRWHSSLGNLTPSEFARKTALQKHAA